ncbi:hypothetical protein DITRI_Ditri04bG0111700 [Diplodiscus trichospermus]
MDIIKTRVAHWSKAKWSLNHVGIMEIFPAPNLISISSAPKIVRPFSSWSKPQDGYLKFNVDGSAIGKLVPVAELIAIKEAMELFARSSWVQNYGLLIESDSITAVKWVLSPTEAPWKLRKTISYIESLKSLIPRWQLRHVYRECNEVADNLAKSGVYRINDLELVRDTQT